MSQYKIRSVPEVFTAAAEHLEKHGWCQGWLQLNGRCCMIGAVFAATDHVAPFSVRNDAWHRLQDEFNGRAGSWNDAEGRTKDEVVAKLRELAEKYAECHEAA